MNKTLARSQTAAVGSRRGIQRLLAQSAGQLLLWAGICLAALLPPALAQTAGAGPSRRLSLTEAIDLALRNNRQIQLAQADADRAAAEHEEARSSFRPRVLFGSGLAYSAGFPLSIEGSAPSIFQINASAALFDRNLRNLERQAGQMRQAAGSSLVETQDQVVAETVLTYLDLDRSRRSMEYLRNEAQNLQALEQITAERVAAGLELPMEATRAQLSAARARSRLAAVENQVSLLEFRLRDLTGIPQSEGILTEGAEVPGLPAGDTLESMTARALENNPSLRAAEEQVRALEFRLQSEEGTRWPRIHLVGQYGLFSKHNNYEEFFQRFQRHNATLGVSIVLPIYQRESYNARISKAQADLAAARYRREEMRAAIARQVRELWGAIQQQAAGREVSRLELDLARKSLDVALAEFDEGRVNRLAVEQARAEENRAWVNLLSADYEAERARLELLRLTGQIRAAFP
ncbi:MAG TPA: TolC family protein [Terriglobia bacterium]|nr:TolC family protein [Terriglobia bacterium]